MKGLYLMHSYYPGITYVIFMGLGLVLLHSVTQEVSPVLSLFITSIFATVFFHLFSKTKIKNLYIACWRNWPQWLAINFVVVIVWLGTYHCVMLLDATTFYFYFSYR